MSDIIKFYKENLKNIFLTVHFLYWNLYAIDFQTPAFITRKQRLLFVNFISFGCHLLTKLKFFQIMKIKVCVKISVRSTRPLSPPQSCYRDRRNNSLICYTIFCGYLFRQISNHAGNKLTDTRYLGTEYRE